MWKLLLFAMALSPLMANAQLTIQITGDKARATPIAVVPFQGAEILEPDPAAIVRSDLGRSGYFASLPVDNMLTQPKTLEQVDFRHWQVLGQEYLVIGQVTPENEGYLIHFQLFNVQDGQKITGYRLTAPKARLRQAGHQISDLIFEHLTGQKGVFQSRIAFLTTQTNTKGGKRYSLNIADAEKKKKRILVASPKPLMSPAWSPKGDKLAYVSFEQNKSSVYVQELATGKRERVIDYPGINGAPAWSPDGGKLALTLSKDGNPDIFVFDLTTRQLKKMTDNFAIDTEAAWSPDGQTLVFTSDRGGKPQLYRMSAQGGRAERLTFDGDYNAGADFSPDGRYLAMVHGNHGDYRIAVMELAGKNLTVLGAGSQDESPSFAPNSRQIIYGARVKGKRRLAPVSVDGRGLSYLSHDSEQARDPAWSP